MEELLAASGEIIYLTTYIDGYVFFLQCLYPSRRSVNYSVAGKKLPMHCTSSGKAMLSYMPAEQVEEIIRIRGLPAITPNTITDPVRFRHELDLCNQRRYAIDTEEESLGVRCVATAICNKKGEVAGALSISGSVISMTEERINTFARLLLNASHALTSYADLFPAIQLMQ
jgi:DNA-binding IclR family transcriptional regulator